MARKVRKEIELENTLLIRELEIALLKVKNISKLSLTRENTRDLYRLNSLLSSIIDPSKNEEPFDWEEHEDK